MKVDWNAIGAIGQWFGAIATFVAVIVALHQNKPKLSIVPKIMTTSIKNNGIASYSISITVTNIGLIPVQVINLGIKLPRRKEVYVNLVQTGNNLPKVLNNGDSVVCVLLNVSGYNIKEVLTVFAVDINGVKYWQNIIFLKKLKRIFWTNFGKKAKKIIN